MGGSLGTSDRGRGGALVRGVEWSEWFIAGVRLCHVLENGDGSGRGSSQQRLKSMAEPHRAPNYLKSQGSYVRTASGQETARGRLGGQAYFNIIMFLCV